MSSDVRMEKNIEIPMEEEEEIESESETVEELGAGFLQRNQDFLINLKKQ